MENIKTFFELPQLKESCTGCMACADVCPKNAIGVTEKEMIETEGFYYPIIDKSKCVECGKCIEFCKSIVKQQRSAPVCVYSMQALDKNILIRATSGAVFELLATKVLDSGGVVFGAVYDDNMVVRHKAAQTVEDIKKMNGSKYVQSDLMGAYIEAKGYLDTGKCVLFSGTPCQIAALKDFVGENKLLITIDVPCYGVPSSKFFAEQIEQLEKKYKAKMTDFRFRDKRKNGFSHTTVMSFKTGGNKSFEKTIDDYSRIPYHYAFSRRNCFMKKCYSCEYTTIERVSDITVSSFWKIEKYTDMYDSREGVSLILANTESGNELLKKIIPFTKNKIHMLDEAIAVNSALTKSLAYPDIRDEIMQSYGEEGFNGILKFYTLSLSSRIKRSIRNKFQNKYSKLFVKY